MFPLTWSNVPSLRATTLIGLFFSIVVGLARASCPSDLSTRAQTCFTTYSVKFQSMQRSPQKLCCGVDVETLRAFCHSYMDGMRCVGGLRTRCRTPQDQDTIDSALSNLDYAKKELLALCANDSIIEHYAMHQSCLTIAGPGSEACFATHRLSPADGGSIRFLSKVNTNNMDDFCRKMRATVSCVQRNIRETCTLGQDAAALASILVKPMVLHSSECDYTVDIAHPQHRQPYQSNPAYISDDFAAGGGRGHRNTGRGGGSRGSNTDKGRGGSGKENLASSSRPSTLVALLMTSLLHLVVQRSFS